MVYESTYWQVIQRVDATLPGYLIVGAKEPCALAKLLPVRVAIVEIELSDESRLSERVATVRGTPRNPMSRAEVIDKVRDLITPSGGAQSRRS